MEPDQSGCGVRNRMDVNNVLLLYLSCMPMYLCLCVCCIYLSLLRGIIKSISLYLESNGESSILYQCVKELRATQLNSTRASQLQHLPPLARISSLNAEHMLPALVFPDSLLVELQLRQLACDRAQADRHTSDGKLGL